MSFRLGKWTLMIALAAGAVAPEASAANLVTNGSFESATGFNGSKENLSTLTLTGWSLGAHGSSGSLGYLVAPGQADNGDYLSVYNGFPNQSPDGGKFVMIDGDPAWTVPIYQTISGLTVGQVYMLTFYQAAGQQAGFTGPTTERWSVTFGSDTQLSHKFELLQGATGQWEKQTMFFQATSASQVLTFLAVGTPNGAPPIAFLDGVSMEAVPEPSSIALAALGIVGVLGGQLRRSRRASA
ncbi:PEP-CTERM sorting domain-containing protein [Paludisphaera rhizosphaerae]|uniref:PEP-CTERM sorting domain-containing protein n=1 Tax=Paludisphaera rhizosphaerae TaxID=2711216 RepID=UPI0013EC6F13|nr:PEP-CTERM sorting domain-containing protein [Paludisphaera rhizosphaerae]